MLTVDGMVDAAAHARFADLGMWVVEELNPNLPAPRANSTSDAYLVSDGGVVGFFHTGQGEYRHQRALVTANLWRDGDLLEEYNKVFDGFVRSSADTVEDFLNLFERFGDLVEKWRLPRNRLGAAYAVGACITLPPFERPRKMRHVVKALRQLDDAGIALPDFYDMLGRLRGAKALERAVAAVMFQQQHAGLNWNLVQEIFV